MTFDKYRDKTNLPINTVFPKENYDYEYVWTKRIGWHIVEGKKLSELPKQKWSIRVPKGV